MAMVKKKLDGGSQIRWMPRYVCTSVLCTCTYLIPVPWWSIYSDDDHVGSVGMYCMYVLYIQGLEMHMTVYCTT